MSYTPVSTELKYDISDWDFSDLADFTDKLQNFIAGLNAAPVSPSDVLVDNRIVLINKNNFIPNKRLAYALCNADTVNFLSDFGESVICINAEDGITPQLLYEIAYEAALLSRYRDIVVYRKRDTVFGRKSKCFFDEMFAFAVADIVMKYFFGASNYPIGVLVPDKFKEKNCDYLDGSDFEGITRYVGECLLKRCQNDDILATLPFYKPDYKCRAHIEKINGEEETVEIKKDGFDSVDEAVTRYCFEHDIFVFDVEYKIDSENECYIANIAEEQPNENS